jgi:uncharacterized protein YdeI (YjbR/CyaY-like superfamily)
VPKKGGKENQKEDIEFVRASDWLSWLRSNHDRQSGVWVVFPKKSTNESSLTYQEALDIALAYGWIDISIRKIDERTFGRKFAPRREKSSWSKTNIGRVKLLSKEGRMTKFGLEAYERRLRKVPAGL